MEEVTGYVMTKLLLQRGIALVYFIAFLVALNQFVPLLGEHGILPVPEFIKHVSFTRAPSVFHFIAKDWFFHLCAWFGLIISGLAVVGITERFGTTVSLLSWFILWALYLSFVNVGQEFYAFGWESILLEAGFFAIFLGAAGTEPAVLMIWIFRWLLFRIMFGAGLIKLRGDDCWRDLTCMFYHYETQPIPNPFSWYFHWLPKWIHQAAVLYNHWVELIVPFAYFAPARFAAIAGIFTIIFQLILFISGNFSFLGLITMILAFSLFSDKILTTWFHFPIISSVAAQPLLYQSSIVLAVVVVILSIPTVINLLSPRQVMNTTYNPLHLVGSYGAFGSITRPRYEVIVEGTSALTLTENTVWQAYEFKRKPGDLSQRPRQVAPYHLRLDWLMWFLPFAPNYRPPWFINFVVKLLEGDTTVLTLIQDNPFTDKPPHYIRARLYKYEFTTPAERSSTQQWWKRSLMQEYLPPASLSKTSE